MAALGVDPGELAIILDILARHLPDREIWAFGSRVTGTAKPYSDLDLAVIGEAPLPIDTAAALAEEFSDSALPFRVDLVDWATTSERFRRIIARDKVVVRAP